MITSAQPRANNTDKEVRPPGVVRVQDLLSLR